MLFSPTFDMRDDGRRAELGPKLNAFNRNVAAAINTLAEHTENNTARLIAAEVDAPSTQDAAREAIQTILLQARAEFEAQNHSLGQLRTDVAEEALTMRVYMQDTREGMERLHAACTEKFDAIKNVDMKDLYVQLGA